MTTTEHRDLLETLGKHRSFLRFTVRDLTDEQAAIRSTASQLCLGALIKHVDAAERTWVDFVLHGPEAMSFGDWSQSWALEPGETLADVLDAYDQTAHRTDDLIANGIDLDAAQPLPEAPWFEPNSTWTARRVVLHIIAETAQHAGHADIIRESIDGAKTMG